jgi:hypothetical protein
MRESQAASPFPPRAAETIRVDSVAEEYAYLTAWPPPDGPWQHVSQVLAPGRNGPEDHLTVRDASGETGVVRFAVRSFLAFPQWSYAPPGEQVTNAMRAGLELAQAEGPLHPGAQALYPVPAESHPEAVAVPLPILAVDAGQRGLYAPARIAVVRWPSAEAVGVGDALGFDPAHWPPPRLGDWPPPGTHGWDQVRLAGTVERFAAIWRRLLDVWFGGVEYLQLPDEKVEARQLLGRLLSEAMLPFYAQLSPPFWAWLSEDSDQTA